MVGVPEDRGGAAGNLAQGARGVLLAIGSRKENECGLHRRQLISIA